MVAKQPRLKGVDVTSTCAATVHFIQAGSGTGVSLAPRYVLTCAHVVAAEDDVDGEVVKGRVGRKKLVMFPSGRVFLSRCVAVRETEDGEEDAALLELEEEIGAGGGGGLPPPPVATLAPKGAEPDDRLFSIGNPSSVDLESVEGGELEFEPPTWHPSVGSCIGGADEGYVGHSCWTYWGHSGAPLFNERGEVRWRGVVRIPQRWREAIATHTHRSNVHHNHPLLCDSLRSSQVVSLHCSWNDETGLRRGQRHGVLSDICSSVSSVKN